MKRLMLFFLIITIINETYSQSISGTVMYKTYREINDDIIKKAATSKENVFNKKIEEEVKNLKLSLSFSGNKSSFSCIEPLHLSPADKRIHFIARILQKVYPNFYANKTQYIEEKDLGGEVFLINRNIDISEWKLVNENKKIGKYTCYKAIRDYKFLNAKNIQITTKQVVWYTLEIPIHFGPKNFVGFPGLVLKVEDGNLIYEVSKIILNPKEGVEVKTPTKGKEITQEEYDKILEESSITIRSEMKRSDRKNN